MIKWVLLFFLLIIIFAGCSRTVFISMSTREYYDLSGKEMAELIQKANDGDGEACFKLSKYYKFANKNEEQMLRWLTRAAELGHVIAQYNLGYYYIFGSVTDHQQAIFWLRKSADKGDIDSYLLLAEIHEKDDTIEDNLFKAKKWYEKAALQGNPGAIEKLSDFYLDGIGCDRNKIKAFALLLMVQERIDRASVKYKDIENKKRDITLTQPEKEKVKTELRVLENRYTKEN